MEVSEARKIYNTISKDIDKLKQAAKEIPAPIDREDTKAFKADGRDIGGISLYTIGVLAFSFNPLWLLYKVGFGAIIVTTILGIGGILGGTIIKASNNLDPDYEKNPSEPFNYNKARALREIAKLESMVEKAYSKYYK